MSRPQWGTPHGLPEVALQIQIFRGRVLLRSACQSGKFNQVDQFNQVANAVSLAGAR